MGVETDRFYIVTDPSALEALQDEWDDLYDRAKALSIGQSFSWCWAAWKGRHQPRNRRLHCIVGRRDERIILIWPFFLRNLTSFPSRAHSLSCDEPLVENQPEKEQWIATAWELHAKLVVAT